MRAIITQIDALPTSRALTYSRCGRGMWSQASPSILRHPVFPPRWGCRPVARFHVIKQSMERRTVASGAFLNAAPCEQKEGLVRKVTMTLTAAAAFAGNHGLAGQCAKPAARRCQHPCAQKRNPDRHAGGVLRGNRLLRLRPRLDQRVLPPVAADAYPAGEGRVGYRSGMLEAASARRPLALT